MKRRRGKSYAQIRKQRDKPDKSKRLRLQPLRNRGEVPGRNAPCPCGSGKKFKKCCGRPEPISIRQSPYKTLAVQYTPAQQRAEQEFVGQWGFNPNPAQLMGYMEGGHDEIEASVLRGMTAINAAPKFHYAVKKLHRLITPKNQQLVTPEEAEKWEAALAEYTDEHGGGVSDDGFRAGAADGHPAEDGQAPATAKGGDS